MHVHTNFPCKIFPGNGPQGRWVCSGLTGTEIVETSWDYISGVMHHRYANQLSRTRCIRDLAVDSEWYMLLGQLSVQIGQIIQIRLLQHNCFQIVIGI